MFKNVVLLVKKTFTYSEKPEKEREVFLNRIAKTPEEKRVYVDACGIPECLQREYGRALRGVTVCDTKGGHKFHRIHVVAAVIHEKNETKKIAPECHNGSMNGEHFERWFECKLLNKVKTGCAILRNCKIITCENYE